MEKTQDFFFTFGLGTILKDKYAKINGTFESAREEMFRLFGRGWCMQHTAEDFDGTGLTEIEDNEKTGQEYKVYSLLEENLKGTLGDYGSEYIEPIAKGLYKKVADKMREGNFSSQYFNLGFQNCLGQILADLVK
jgi:hypothetical protein